MHTLFSAVRFSADAASRRQGRSTAARSLVLSSSTSLLSRAMAGGCRGAGGGAGSPRVRSKEGRSAFGAAPKPAFLRPSRLNSGERDEQDGNATNQTASCTSAACAGGDRRRLPRGCCPRRCAVGGPCRFDICTGLSFKRTTCKSQLDVNTAMPACGAPQPARRLLASCRPQPRLLHYALPA